MCRPILAIIAILAAQTQADPVWKCCGFGEILSPSYGCEKDLTKRLQVSTNLTDFFAQKTDGACSEATRDGIINLVLYGGEIIAESLTKGKFFPKCCPLGYLYDPRLHSCAEKGDYRHDFVKGHFVDVGLPQCQLIVDLPDPDLGQPGVDHCLDEDRNGVIIRRECRNDTRVCEEQRCVKKCCPDGKSFVGGSECLDTYTHGVNLSFSSNVEDPTGPFAVISNRTCRRIYLMSEQRYIFTLEKDGVFKYYQNITKSFVAEEISAEFPYCIEHSNKPSAKGFFFFKCFVDKDLEDKFVYTKWPKILSCVFLILTILIYLVLDETRNLFGKILINYCTGTLCLFLLLIYAHNVLEPTDTYCTLTGYGLIFFSTVLFAWLNVMCCDIWLTFGLLLHTLSTSTPAPSKKPLTTETAPPCTIPEKLPDHPPDFLKIFSSIRGSIRQLQLRRVWTLIVQGSVRTTKHSIGKSKRKKDLRRLFLYMSYGWGMPLILTLIVYMFSTLSVLPAAIQPYVGVLQCFIESRKNNYAAILFLRLPHLIIQIINTVLFIQTISYCLRIKNEINRIDDTTRHQQKYKFKRDQERLFLILKLSVIMGVNYIFDVLSAFVKMSELGSVAKYIEVTWDCINCLQGVFIFMIFICKKKIYNDFLRKLNIRRTNHSLDHTQTHSMTSGTTRASLRNGRNSLK